MASFDVIPVGDGAAFVALSPNGAHLYVTNMRSHTVSVIDTSTRKVIRNPITFSYYPFGVAVTQSGARVYVTSLDPSGMVSVIDTATNQVVRSITVGDGPVGVAMAPTGNRAYVANSGSDTVSVIDTINHKVVNTIPIPLQPPAMPGQPPRQPSPAFVAVAPVGNRAYVTNFGSDSVSVINTTGVLVPTIPAGSAPLGVAVAPDNRRVYVANVLSDNLSVIDTATMGVATIAVGPGPLSVAVAPSDDHVYVSNTTDSTVSVIDTDPSSTTSDEVVSTLRPAGQYPPPPKPWNNPMGLVATTKNVYLAHAGLNGVLVIDV